MSLKFSLLKLVLSKSSKFLKFNRLPISSPYLSLKHDMEPSFLRFYCRSNTPVDNEDYVVRIRGLPWAAHKGDIVKFFEGINIKNDGIHMTLNYEGRPSGEAYVELENEEDLTKAIDRHNEHMGHRYIEVFSSKRSEMEWAIERMKMIFSRKNFRGV